MKKRIEYWNYIVLCIIGGWFGLQEFYIRRWYFGIVDILFFWSGIPAVLSFIDVCTWLFDGQDEFNKKFNRTEETKQLLID